MNTEDKYLSGEGLSYFTSVADAHIVRSLEEITDPGYSNETNIIVFWGAGERIKCVAPDEVGFDTKMIYLGTNIYYDSPSGITVSNNGTTQTVVFGENNEYTMIRTRNSSSEPWPSTFYTLNSDSLWNESAKRTQRATGWYKPDGSTTTDSQFSEEGNTVGRMTPNGWAIYRNDGVRPTYGY